MRHLLLGLMLASVGACADDAGLIVVAERPEAGSDGMTGDGGPDALADGGGDGLCAWGQDRPITGVGTGRDHTCVVVERREVWCRGQSDDGQAGIEASVTALTRVSGLDGDVQAVVAGHNHSCALLGDGTVWCWGKAGYLGSDGPSSALPRLVAGGPYTKLATFRDYTCGLTPERTIECWGELDSNASVDVEPVEQWPGEAFTTMDVGYGKICAVHSSGDLWCRGWLLMGDSVTSWVILGTDTPWQSVCAGVEHICGLRSDGVLFCYGANGQGQLGLGDTEGRDEFMRVRDDVDAVICGHRHTCALSSGRLLCWGRGEALGLGVAAGGDVSSPRAVDLPSVAAGDAYEHMCVVTSAGGHLCWGSNGSEQLGDRGGDVPSVVPSPVSMCPSA